MSVIGPTVPAEIIRTVFENLDGDRSSLCELAITSRFFNIEATRLLYRTMTMEDGNRHYMFLSTIQRKPALAALIRKYHMPQTPPPRGRSFPPLLSECLSLMTGLKELAYLGIWKAMKLGIPQVKKGQPFPFQLEKLIWAASLSRLGHGHGNELLEFFKTQPNLQEFVCTNFSLVNSIPAESLPNLKVVEGDTYAIKDLVPTRYITEIYWRKCSGVDLKKHTDPRQPLFCDAVFAKVRGLCLEQSAWSLLIDEDGPMQLFLDLASQGLQVLEIQLDLDQLHRAILVPPMFPKLKRVCFRSYYPNQEIPIHIDELLRLFDKCPDLVYLDIFIAGNNYRRWVSRDAAPRVVAIPDEYALRPQASS